MASGNAIRGTRVGSSPVRWVDATAERMEVVPRRVVGYWCANRHHTEHSFAADVPAPAMWDCPRCGLPVKERRSEADAAAILAEAMQRLRARRGE